MENKEAVDKVTDFIKKERGLQHTADVLMFWFSLTDEQKTKLFNRAMDS